MANLLALGAATAVLVTLPGPNVALIVATSLRYGFRLGAVTVLGTTLGVALQLGAVVMGMAAVIDLAADALTWLRWAGVVYLVWLGIQSWREPAGDLTEVTAAPVAFWRGCLIAALNPKTLLFNAAFLPQFASTGTPGELVIIAGVFLTVLLVGDMLWAAFANSARRFLAAYSQTRNRITGGFLIAAGVGLALARLQKQ